MAAKPAPKAALIPRDRADLEAAFAEVKAAEAILAEAVVCGDTHDACVEALDRLRRALNGAPPYPPEEKAA